MPSPRTHPAARQQRMSFNRDGLAERYFDRVVLRRNGLNRWTARALWIPLVSESPRRRNLIRFRRPALVEVVLEPIEIAAVAVTKLK